MKLYNKYDSLYNYGKTYKNTNEKLKEIFLDIDFKDKNVLSVMSSSDQVFSAYYLGASNVDTFDKNILTYYLFYLKKWYLMFYKNYILDTNSNNLLKSLSMVSEDNEEELEIFKFWNKVLNENSDISSLFYNNIYDWNVPYTENIDKMINIIKNKQANFINFNLFNKLNISNKYDIIILSNILDDMLKDSKNNEIIGNNLSSILNDNGIVVCSILNNKINIERELFNRNFIYELPEKKVYNKILKREVPIYYIYRKKDLHK